MSLYCRCISPRVSSSFIRKISAFHSNPYKCASSSLTKVDNLPKSYTFIATQYRCVRTMGSKDDSDEAKESSRKGDQKRERGGPEFPKNIKDVEDEFRRRLEQLSKEGKIKVEVRNVNVKGMLRTAVIIWFAIGLLISAIIVSVLTGGAQSKTEFDHLFSHSPHISFEVFVQKYLPTGETTDQSVIIECDRLTLVDPFKFVEEVRKAEEKLGIQRRDGIQIDHVRDISIFGVISFVVGMSILIWLGIQYVRLMRKSFVKWRKNK